jgi:glycerol-3-phosphate acyltransferase PlsY
MRLGGFKLALLVLSVEVVKGVTAVAAGSAIADDSGAVAAGLGAIAGNVYNVWLGFHGGKGLGISGGVLLGVWPVMFPIALLVLVLNSALTRSSGKGTLISLGVVVIGALLWDQLGWGDAWGVEDSRLLLATALGFSLILVRKHWYDARHPIKSPVPR